MINHLKDAICVTCGGLVWFDYESTFKDSRWAYAFECQNRDCELNNGVTKEFPGHLLDWNQMSVIKARLFVEQNERLVPEYKKEFTCTQR